MRYHGIKVYSIIHQCYALANKHLENYWFRYLGDCQILLKVYLIKLDGLLSILNQIKNNIQFTMEESQTKTTFFRYYDQQKWCKNLDGYLQQTTKLNTICPI